jgi:hypothetical protein
MILNVYSVFDSIAGNYNTPFFLGNDALARRTGYDLVHDEKSIVHSHPSDFSIYHIGAFDTDSGELQMNDNGKPRFICKMSNFTDDH